MYFVSFFFFLLFLNTLAINDWLLNLAPKGGHFPSCGAQRGKYLTQRVEVGQKRVWVLIKVSLAVPLLPLLASLCAVTCFDSWSHLSTLWVTARPARVCFGHSCRRRSSLGTAGLRCPTPAVTVEPVKNLSAWLKMWPGCVNSLVKPQNVPLIAA